ncbi:MAG TPA: sigma-70 family RNA polymerase sigma factor [Anaerolineae bacterium]|nr:sigma-70 family RNA polymerase sigma factor [Anaerolineae bacterium]HQH38166.1 sigma-70 family RNA polymerase sigma factor [Anaerolineae bacterium]
MEEEWLLSAQRGEEEAVNRLVTCYQQAVFNLCYRMLGEYTEAEDAAQEALVKAVMHLHTYDPERPFKPWLLRIASNECIDRIRRRKPTVSLDGMGDDGAWEWQAGHSPNPEVEMLQQERQVHIQELLQDLPPLDRTIITLFYWEGLSYTEIGEATGLSLSAIKSRLFRARRTMAQFIVEEEVYVA